MNLDLKDRIALVTGASGDIGSAVATTFAREGARVAVGWYRREERAEELVAALAEVGGTAHAVRLDQGDPATISTAVAEVEAQLGRIDVLVANAVAWPTPTEGWDSLVEGIIVNIAGTITVAETVLAGMRAAGWGRIVLVSSDVVDQPMPAAAGYPAAKAAIEAGPRPRSP